MRPKEQILQNPRLKIVQAWKSGLMGYLLQPQAGPREVSVVARWDDDTEHVSVAAQNRDPTQGEMRMVQEIFWGEGERVVQRNPRFKLHGHGLHLWKENGAAIGFLAGFEEAKTERRYEDADEEPEIYRPIPMEHTHGGED